VTGRATTVVFDLGGVLIDWDPRHLYRQLFGGDEAGMERFLAEVCTFDWNAQQDAGRPWRVGVEELASRHPEQRALIAAYDERWNEMLGEAFDDTVAIIAELRAGGIPVYALSNWSAEKFPYALQRFPFLAWFRGIVISGDVGVTKPDPRIFRYLFERHGIEPATAVCVDDAPWNVAAAAALGMIALRFESAAALRRELHRLGLPVRAEAPRAAPAVDAQAPRSA
jgi:2-haloacid dehalogenase